MQTNVASGTAQANKILSAALFAQAIKEPSPLKNMMGPAPTQAMAEGILRQQSDSYMPIVQIMDLAQTAGDKVSVDIVGVVKGRPIMGDRNAEGRGAKMGFGNQEIKIDMATVPVDAGGKMSQKRTFHNLRSLAINQLKGIMPRLIWERCLVHAAGARGYQDGQDWIVPLQADAEFAEIMINNVMAPTYNRHFVVDGADFVQGGAQVASVDSTDMMKLSHLDRMALILDEMTTKMMPIRLAGDPVAGDDPIKAVMMVDPAVWDSILTDNTAGYNIRSYQAAAVRRASYGDLAKHPLFSGEPMFWNGILIKKMNQGIRFPSGTSMNIVTQANRLTATESTITVPALGTTFQVGRSLVWGAQAVASALGKNATSGLPYTLLENKYDFQRKLELAGEIIGGEMKLRFSMANSNGDMEPTDLGIVAIDSVIRKLDV